MNKTYLNFPLTASPVVSQPDRTEGGRPIFAKLGQCGQHTSQRTPIRSKTIFVTRFGHQEALHFFTIEKLKLQFKPCLSMNQNFFFCGLKGGLKLFTNKQKNFGSGPFLILHGRLNVFSIYSFPRWILTESLRMKQKWQFHKGIKASKNAVMPLPNRYFKSILKSFQTRYCMMFYLKGHQKYK